MSYNKIPQDTLEEESRLKKAFRYHKAEKYLESLDECRKILDKNPKCIPALLQAYRSSHMLYEKTENEDWKTIRTEYHKRYMKLGGRVK